MKTPAELKAQHKEKKSLIENIILASLMISFALISNFFEFETLSSRIVMAAAIITASLLGLFLLVRWLKSLDEYESGVNARASMIALYSSLLYLPLQYLNEIGFLPEVHIIFLFMFMWLVYLVSVLTHHIK